MLVEDQAFGVEDLHRVTVNAVQAAFCDQETKDLLRARVDAGYGS